MSDLSDLQTLAPATPATPSTVRKRGKQFTLGTDLRDLAPNVGTALTLRELAALHAMDPKAAANCMHMLGKWLDKFQLGDLLAWEVKPDHLHAGCEAMKAAGYAQGTINRDLSQLGTLYKWAAKHKHTPSGFVSPTMNLKREEAATRYVRPPTAQEWQAIRLLAKGSSNPKFTLLVWLIMDTGCRRSEVTDRAWNEFDLDDPAGPCITLPPEATKTGKPRRVYFSTETAQLLRKLRPVDKWRSEPVWGGRGASLSNMQTHWKALRALTGRGEDFTLRDLRHMVAAQLLIAGKGVAQVSQVLGNSSLVLQKHYGHLDDANLRNIQAERLGLDAQPAATPVQDAVADAKRREAERAASAPTPMTEMARLQLVMQDAMAAMAALTAAQATAPTRGAA